MVSYVAGALPRSKRRMAVGPHRRQCRAAGSEGPIDLFVDRSRGHDRPRPEVERRPAPGAFASWRGDPRWSPGSSMVGAPDGPKCGAKRPSLRAKARKSTGSPAGVLDQSSRTAGLPCSDSRSLIRVAAPRVVGEQRECTRVDRETCLAVGGVVGDAVLRHARRVADHHRRPRELVGLEDRPVEVVHVRRRRLGDIDLAVCHEDAPQLLAGSGRPCWPAPKADSLVTWPPNDAVEACPPVFE